MTVTPSNLASMKSQRWAHDRQCCLAGAPVSETMFMCINLLEMLLYDR